MQKTPLYDRHVALAARIVDFAGWQMPIQYPQGIVAEHLAVRRTAGIFDVSHMGRFRITGTGAVPFLRQALTNDAAALPVGSAHYTMLANEAGGAIDDAFLYRPADDKYLLVVNASNKQKDLLHLQALAALHEGAVLEDVSGEVAMIALQGPQSENIMQTLLTEGGLPASARNSLASFKLAGVDVCAARTGYTGEPVCFEIFVTAEHAPAIWDRLIEQGAAPVGLGARDTLRLEAGLPLYGHELGIGKDNLEIPVFAIPQARFAVSFDDPNRPFIGRKALVKQSRARAAYKTGNFGDTAALPKIVRRFRLTDPGIAREGAIVHVDGRPAGWVTSGTMVPYWQFDHIADTVNLDSYHGRPVREKDSTAVTLKDTHAQRAIGLCMVEPHVEIGAEIEIEVRARKLKAQVVPRNLQNTKAPQTWAVM